jgi:hypothetical protein
VEGAADLRGEAADDDVELERSDVLADEDDEVTTAAGADDKLKENREPAEPGRGGIGGNWEKVDGECGSPLLDSL